MKNLIAHTVGRLAVTLHYRHWLDIYALCSVHEPERYRRSQRKAKIPSGIRWAVWRRDYFTCVYCLAWGDNLSLDHIVPETYGGEAVESNLVTSCTKCNNKKAQKSFHDFINSKWLNTKRTKNLQRLSTIQATPIPKSLSDTMQHISTITGKKSS